MNTKRIVSLLLLAAMLLALLCACGNKPADTTTPDNTGDTTPAADTSDKTNDTADNSDAEKPADDATEAPADNNAPQLDDAEVVAAGEGIEVDLATVELPLVDEPITLTAWRSYDPYGEWTDFNNSDWRKAVAEDTGVTVNFTTATAATANEKFGLMLVSQDYTDLMMIPSLSALKSGDAAIEDEIVINLNDYDSSLYPHYYEFITSNSARWKGTHTDTGKLWGFFTILKEPEGGWTGPAYRSDLAADCGWTGGDPVTLQDWEDLLTCYRDGGIPVPLSFSYQGYYAYGMFASAFDTFPGLYAKNGTDVTYGFIDDGFKEYLTLMNEWYNEGLILSNFIDWDNDHSKQAAYGMKYDNIYWGDDVAAGMSVFSFTKRQLHDSYKWNENENCYIQAVPAPVQTEGQILHTGYTTTYVQAYPLAIAATCENMEDAIRFCDFFYTKKGYLYSNYGIEGVTYNLDENGNPVSTDVLLDSEYEYTQQKLANWCWRIGLYTYLQSKEDFTDQTVYDAYDIWASNYDGAWAMPTGITLTVEESEEYTSRFNDITTYMSESIPKFITGDLNLEGDWDTFVTGVKNMGIDRCLEIQTEALARYNAR